MYPVSKDVISLFQNSQRQVIRVTLKEGAQTIVLTEADILSRGFEVDRYCTSGQNIEIGAATAAELTLKLSNATGKFDAINFEGKELFAEIGVKDWSNPDAELIYLPIGYFTVDETPRKLASITLSALDRMVLFDKDYLEPIAFPITVAELLKKICAACGIALATDTKTLTNGDYTIAKHPEVENATYRLFLQWIGEITGTCAYIDWDGMLRLEWFQDTGLTLSAAERRTSDMQERSISLSGVKIVTEEKEDDLKEDNYSFLIENNPLFQDNISDLFSALSEKLNGLTYRPYNATTRAFPFLWPLDIITWKDKAGNAFQTVITHTNHKANGSSTIKAVGDTATKRKYSRSDPMTKQMEAMISATYVKTKIFTAEVANLNQAFIGDLNAIRAEIEDLKVGDLSALSGEIVKLTSSVANINTLLSGQLVSGSAQTIVLNAQNATIDKALITDVIAAQISVGDLMAGRISTNRFEIGSDDGTTLIKDSTIQIKDANGTVRVQLGEDAGKDHNLYIWDKDGKLLFDAAGLTKDGASRPIITDTSVAEDAAISGSKLDIDSVIKEINGSSTTIKASQIQFDETEQTLEVSFSQITQSVEKIEQSKMYRVEILSDNGFLFKNGNVRTTLRAHVWSWDEDVTDILPEEAFIWKRASDQPEQDAYWNQEYGIGKKQIVLTNEDVDGQATFSCELTL